MTTAEILYELQEVDDAIEAKEQRLAEVQEQLGESEELLQARARLEASETQLYELEKQQRQQELELESVTSKIESEEERLYGGQVTNPKELAGLQKEVRYLRERSAELEDELLETMMAREEARELVAEHRAALEKIESSWEEEQATLVRERDQLQAELAELRSRHEELVSQVPPNALGVYEYLRRTKGLAVAQFQDGMCLGCRVRLPAVDRRRVQSEDLVTCSNCGRVLVVA